MKELREIRTVGAVSRVTIDLIYAGVPHLPAPGEEVRCREFTVALGGGPLVTPIRLGRCGVPVRLGVFLGQGLESELARRLLRAQGCAFTELACTGQPVTVSSVVSLDGERAIVSEEEPLSGADPAQAAALLGGCGCAVIPLHPELARTLRGRGVELIYDATCPDGKVPGSFLSMLSVITPNRREAEVLTGEREMPRALRALRDAGVQTPVVKLGSEGCLCLWNGETVAVPPARGIAAADTTGAGDNFLAGFLYGYARGWTTPECARMANVFGGLSTAALGALGADLSEREALELYRGEERKP